MKIQSINNNKQSFGVTSGKVSSDVSFFLGEEAFKSANVALSKLIQKSKGDNFVKISSNFAFAPIGITDPNSGAIFLLVGKKPTDQILVSARKQAKTFLEKIKVLLDLTNISTAVAKSLKEEDIVEAGEKALANLK